MHVLGVGPFSRRVGFSSVSRKDYPNEEVYGVDVLANGHFVRSVLRTLALQTIPLYCLLLVHRRSNLASWVGPDSLRLLPRNCEICGERPQRIGADPKFGRTILVWTRIYLCSID